jgi:murein L,D-transpeptidase YcbB/YkuD
MFVRFLPSVTALMLAIGPALAESPGDEGIARPAIAAPAPAAPAAASVFSGDLAGALLTAGLPQRLATLGLDPASLAEFYARRGHRALWVADSGLTPEGRALLSTLRGAAEAGCHTIDAAITRADALRSVTGAGDLVELELVLSGALAEAAYAAVAPFEATSKASLLARLDMDDLAGSVTTLLPSERDYWALVGAYWRYVELARAGGWPVVPAGPKLELGARDPRVAALRARLAMTDGAPADIGEPDLFDRPLEDAVKRFQLRHGLSDDGVVGFKSIDALNVPVETRLKTLAFNLKKRHGRPVDWGDRYIVVNIAAARLTFVDDGQTVYASNTVVGRPDRQTPELDSAINRLEFNPYWTVPPRIARVDLLPKAQRDPNFFPAHGIRIYSGWEEAAEEIDPATIDWFSAEARAMRFRLRQDPGPENALGPVKFLFPNPYDVYLHGTNHPELFVKPARFFSSGCIRLPRPLELAALVLRDDPDWDPARIQSAVEAGINTPVPLRNPVPIHLVYRTAWVDPDGTLEFRDDVYGRDRLAAVPTLAQKELR